MNSSREMRKTAFSNFLTRLEEDEEEEVREIKGYKEKINNSLTNIFTLINLLNYIK